MISTRALGRFGPFLVDAAGVLHAADRSRPVGFGFRWRGRRVRAELHDDARLSLSVVAAHVPFTAEAAALRPGVFAALAALRVEGDEDWRIALTPGHAVVVAAVEHLGAPATASRLIAAATRFVLRLAPCLDLLDDAGARPA
ncbi:hypothetical protein [Elioraea sp.]|uniref:hypothetical protein n=1 Tax=Elioraea sp. TaxID=2185103 RepID=UPI003F704FEE